MNLALTCPGCKRRVKPTSLMQYATMVVRRTCRCGRRWSVTIKPLGKIKQGWVHQLDWHPIQ